MPKILHNEDGIKTVTCMGQDKMTPEDQFEYNCRHAENGDVVACPNELNEKQAILIMEKVENETMNEIPGSSANMRQFDTGATRNTDTDKLDYDGFLCPLVIKRYAEYLNEHRVQADGKLRDSDNWQKGIPIKVYMKSKWRHFMDTWMIFRGYGPVYDSKDNHIITMEEALCGEIFNASGHLHELLKEKLKPRGPQPETIPDVNEHCVNE